MLFSSYKFRHAFLLLFSLSANAAIDCENLREQVCSTSGSLLQQYREEVKSIIRDEAIRYVSSSDGLIFRDFNDFSIYIRKQGLQSSGARLTLQKYQVCMSLVALDLYGGTFNSVSESCKNINGSSQSLADMLDKKIKASRLSAEFFSIKAQFKKYLEQHKIMNYFNNIEMIGVQSNFESYFDSASLVSPLSTNNSSADIQFYQNCGLDGMTFQAYNARNSIAYCPGYILKLINFKKKQQVSALPTDQLNMPKQLRFADYEVSTSPENGLFVVYHELAHCLTFYHRAIQYNDPAGNQILACYQNKFKNSFGYTVKSQNTSLISTLVQKIYKKKDADLFVDETLADHLAAKLFAQDLQGATKKLLLLKKNTEGLCSNKANEDLVDAFQTALHPSIEVRLDQIALTPLIRKALGCEAVPNTDRCDYLDGIK